MTSKLAEGVPNEVCIDCEHHALQHVFIGPNGNGCQELGGGEFEATTCGCLNYLLVKPTGPLTAVWVTYEDD